MALKDQDDLASDSIFQKRVLFSLLNYIANTVLAETTSEVQTVGITAGTPTAGAFVLSGGPLVNQVTIVFNESAGTLQPKLEAAMDPGAVAVCLGGPLPGTPISVTFQGNLADKPQGTMAASGSTMTPAGTPGVTRTTPGVAAPKNKERKALGLQVIRSPESYRGSFVQMVTTNAAVMSAAGSPANQTNVSDAQINAAVAAVYNAFLGA